MGSSLLMGSCLTSPSGRFALNMQTDGNLVLYDHTSSPARALWNTVTQLLPLDPIVAMKTLYFYDALGNLYCVEQHGTAATGTACPSTPPSPTTPVAPDPSNAWRRRMFGYDSLSRLLWASNPESGIIQYLYDADSNLLQKTSPAPNQTGSATQTISYCYDALHRVTGKGYGAQSCPLSAPVVSYSYDGGTNGVGRLTSLTDQAGSGTYTYDPMGRPKTETRVINGVSRTITYDYYLDGSLNVLHYPSNRTVTYTVNGGSRVTAATDGNGTQYVVNATSYPPGAEYQRSMPGIYFRTDMNPRLQVSGFYSDDGNTTSRYMNKSYSYGVLHQNNGNVVSIINNKDSNRTQSFTYDPLNRITAGWTTANTGTLSWGENYTIDAWGNLQINPMGGKAHGGYLPNASTAQNQMTGMGYDAAGNMTQYTAPNQYYYDPENRIQLAGGMTYTYDADGNRVEKASGSTGTLYWYSSVGVIAETDVTGATKSEYVFFGGKRVARIDSPGNSLHYYLSDHLNSTSMIVGTNGVPEEESDYSPYGTEYVVTAGPNHYKFTGKERDTETSPASLDYLGARYYGSVLGRFITADSLGGHPEDPQTLNKYSYVRNSPINLADPTGLDFYLTCTHSDSNADSCKQQQVGTDKNGNAINAWVQGVTVNGQFTATLIGNDANGNLVDKTTGSGNYSASVTGAGVNFKPSAGQAALGIFANGTAPTTIEGSGSLLGFTFNFLYSNLAQNQTAGGTLQYKGYWPTGRRQLLDAGFNNLVWDDKFNHEHVPPPGMSLVHFRSWGDGYDGAHSAHLILFVQTNPRSSIPDVTNGEFHLGEHDPFMFPFGSIAHCREIGKC